MWTYAALKTAYQAITPAPAELTAACATLNAQTVDVAADLATTDVDRVLVPTGEMYAVTQLAAKATSGASPPTAEDQAIVAAWNVVRMLTQWQTIQTSNATLAGQVKAALSGLVAAGVVSSASVAALEALMTQTVPVWQPALTVGDLQTAGV